MALRGDLVRWLLQGQTQKRWSWDRKWGSRFLRLCCFLATKQTTTKILSFIFGRAEGNGFPQAVTDGDSEVSLVGAGRGGLSFLSTPRWPQHAPGLWDGIAVADVGTVVGMRMTLIAGVGGGVERPQGKGVVVTFRVAAALHRAVSP